MLLHLRIEDVAAPGNGFQKLVSITQSTPKLDRALHQRIIRNEAVRPHHLYQFLLADEASRVLHKILQRLVNLGTKLDLCPCPEHTTFAHIQREFAELIADGPCLHVCSRTAEASKA